VLRDGLAAVQEQSENLYLAIPLRNVASGLAVLHGWVPMAGGGPDAHTPAAAARALFGCKTRDLYVPAGDVSFWQAAIREARRPAVRTTGARRSALAPA